MNYTGEVEMFPIYSKTLINSDRPLPKKKNMALFCTYFLLALQYAITTLPKKETNQLI